MKYSEARPGRCFVIRLEHGDVLHESLEQFAAEHEVRAATVIALGGADVGSKLVVGPEQGDAKEIVPMEYVLEGVHEVCGVGTIFPDGNGRPTLHMHVSCGRKNQSVAGCVRRGVKTWHVMEVVMQELQDSSGKRVLDEKTGFELLMP